VKNLWKSCVKTLTLIFGAKLTASPGLRRFEKLIPFHGRKGDAATGLESGKKRVPALLERVHI
jgi:hypothetical protein